MPEADIHRAVRVGDVGWLRRLLSQHPDRVNTPLLVTSDTPLHIASYEGMPEIVHVLLDWGADVDSRDDDEETPLHKAVNYRADSYFKSLFLGRKCLIVARLLIDHQANINARDVHGNTPLHLAALLGRAPFIELLLAHDADPIMLNDHGLTPLRMAMKNSQHHAADLLRSYGDDVPFSGV